jgi:hypothetical protein
MNESPRYRSLLPTPLAADMDLSCTVEDPVPAA